MAFRRDYGDAMTGIITLDIGTTSLRAILHDERGRIAFTERHDNVPTHYEDGRVEQDLEAYNRNIPSVLAACANFAAESQTEVAAVSVTAQRSSVIPGAYIVEAAVLTSGAIYR
jgi:glycerol kinase